MSTGLYPIDLLKYHIVLVLSESPNNSAKHDLMTTKVLRSIGGNSIRGKNRALVEADVTRCIAQLARTQFLDIYVATNKRVRLKPGFERYLLRLQNKASAIETATSHEAVHESKDSHSNPKSTFNGSSKYQLTTSNADEDWEDDEDDFIINSNASASEETSQHGSTDLEPENHLEDDFFGLPEFPEDVADIRTTTPPTTTVNTTVDSTTNRLTELSRHLANIGKPPDLKPDSMSIHCGEGINTKIVRIFEAIDHHLELQIEVRQLSARDIERFLEYQCNSSCVFTLCKTFSGRYYLKRLIQTSKYTNDEIIGIIERLYRNALDVGA